MERWLLQQESNSCYRGLLTIKLTDNFRKKLINIVRKICHYTDNKKYIYILVNSASAEYYNHNKTYF